MRERRRVEGVVIGGAGLHLAKALASAGASIDRALPQIVREQSPVIRQRVVLRAVTSGPVNQAAVLKLTQHSRVQGTGSQSPSLVECSHEFLEERLHRRCQGLAPQGIRLVVERRLAVKVIRKALAWLPTRALVRARYRARALLGGGAHARKVALCKPVSQHGFARWCFSDATCVKRVSVACTDG